MHGNRQLVTIVMCTYNGEKFLEEQLNSFLTQTHHEWRLYVSDDGSADSTCDLIKEFSTRIKAKNEVVLVAGIRKGFAANFLTAACQSPASDFYAFADQDDIWEPHKLERALSRLAVIPQGKPALYCARTRIADVDGQPVGLSLPFGRRPSFANALVQNIGGGNTMVMNDAARELLRRADQNLEVGFHDWWSYQLISGAGGEVIYDPEPHVLYRQHTGNLVGENNSISARFNRLTLFFRGRFKFWMDCNLDALSRVRHLLTPENRVLLDALKELRRQSFLRRAMSIRKMGIERQTWAGNIGLAVAMALGKL
jgi:glycosyltransferase involved in cell wall biosynthesis